MSRVVVLLTHDAGLVPDAVAARGGRAVVVDPREIPLAVPFSQRDAPDGSTAWLDHAGVRVTLDDAAVWVGDLDVAAHLPTTLPAPVRTAAVGESLRAFVGVLDALPGRVLDPPRAVRAGQNPLTAAAALRAEGLDPPAMWIGVDPDGLTAFMAEHAYGVEELPGGAPVGPRVARWVRAHPGPGDRVDAWVIGEAVGGAPEHLADPLRRVARRLGLGLARVELFRSPEGAWRGLGTLPLRPDPADPSAADALAAALCDGPP